MKELEHVLQRVRIKGLDGVERKLKESIYSVLRVLADATLKDAPERGCQMSIPEIVKRARKERSTVLAALAGAQRLGLLTRHAPASGARYTTHVNLINIRLVEASQKSRPFLGSAIVFDESPIPPKKTPKNATFKDSEMKKTQQTCDSQELLDVQNLDVQILDREHVLNTPPRPESTLVSGLGAERDRATSPPPLLSPCPIGAGGCGSDFKALSSSVFEDLKIFSDFLEKNKVSGLSTFCQRRKKNGKRGGTFCDSTPGNFGELSHQVRQAAVAGFELTMQSTGLILLDDLTENNLAEFLGHCFESAVIETSPKNFQALLSTGPGWSTDQIRSTQRALAAQFGADGNATAARQLHRLPGSLNKKNNGLFVTRLYLIQPGSLIEPIDTQLAGAFNSPAQSAQHRSPFGRDITPSGADFGRACQLISGGASHDLVVAEIASRAAARSRLGDHLSYAQRTAKNATLQLHR